MQSCKWRSEYSYTLRNGREKQKMASYQLGVIVAWALCVIITSLLVNGGTKNVSWQWESPLQGWGNLTVAFIMNVKSVDWF